MLNPKRASEFEMIEIYSFEAVSEDYYIEIRLIYIATRLGEVESDCRALFCFVILVGGRSGAICSKVPFGLYGFVQAMIFIYAIVIVAHYCNYFLYRFDYDCGSEKVYPLATGRKERFCNGFSSSIVSSAFSELPTEFLWSVRMHCSGSTHKNCDFFGTIP